MDINETTRWGSGPLAEQHQCKTNDMQRTRLEQLEHERNLAATRLATVSREPNPWLVDGFAFVDWRKASDCRARLQLRLVARIERLTSEINHLAFGLSRVA